FNDQLGPHRPPRLRIEVRARRWTLVRALARERRGVRAARTGEPVRVVVQRGGEVEAVAEGAAALAQRLQLLGGCDALGADAPDALATPATSPRSASSMADRLTGSLSGAPPGPWVAHVRARAHACSRTKRPSGTISPVSSASGMNSPGGMRPRPGWSQRTSAS